MMLFFLVIFLLSAFSKKFYFPVVKKNKINLKFQIEGHYFVFFPQ